MATWAHICDNCAIVRCRTGFVRTHQRKPTTGGTSLIADSLVEAIANLDEQTAIRLVKERLDADEDPVKILENAWGGMELVGKKFAAAEFFIPDLIYSGEILSQIAALTKHKILCDERHGRSD